MAMGPFAMLKANQTQTPNGTAVNASQLLGGLPGLGTTLQDDLAAELKKRREAGGLSNPVSYGAAAALGMR